jgi:hypothetical protein
MQEQVEKVEELEAKTKRNLEVITTLEETEADLRANFNLSKRRE